jgi:hypothetical protein
MLLSRLPLMHGATGPTTHPIDARRRPGRIGRITDGAAGRAGKGGARPARSGTA